MIVQETYISEDGRRMIRRYSDRGVFIHGGNPVSDYEDSIDPEDAVVSFEETDKPIDDGEISDSEALAIITGEEVGE
jgi:hypothetical protein